MCSILCSGDRTNHALEIRFTLLGLSDRGKPEIEIKGIAEQQAIAYVPTPVVSDNVFLNPIEGEIIFYCRSPPLKREMRVFSYRFTKEEADAITDYLERHGYKVEKEKNYEHLFEIKYETFYVLPEHSDFEDW